MGKRLIILSALVLFVASASAQQDTLKYRISLRDKAATVYSLEHPEQFLSEKAIARRQKQNLAVDSTDLPVCRQYIDEIRRQGVNIVVVGKWENFVTVSCNDSALIEHIAALPFVRATEKVWTAPKMNKGVGDAMRDSVINEPKIYTDSIYGPALTQIQLSNGDKLHDAGFRGQGMTIAVIDAGFHAEYPCLGHERFCQSSGGFICGKQSWTECAFLHRNESAGNYDRYCTGSFLLAVPQ